MKCVNLFAVAVILHLATATPVSYYKQLSPSEADRLAAWTPNSKEPMWQASGQYEGDIVLTPDQRNGVINTRLRWPNNEIPYEFSSDFNEDEIRFITDALNTEYAKTCVRPRPRRATDTNYVTITGKNTGCWSYVGRLGGRQELNLQRNGCVWYGTICHEMLHAAGFYHQHSATERDDWVDIKWDNIRDGTENNFVKYEANVISSFEENYDYGSVMHYNGYAFSANGLPTIVPKDPNAEIGQRNGLSDIDIRKLNKMYNCA